MLEMFESKNGKIIFSIILGLGLAALFRNTCKDYDCLIIKCKNPNTIINKINKYNNKCYKYKPYMVSCK